MAKGKKFNQKNVLAFADNLYKKTKAGNEYYVPLCWGGLAHANGEITHCILGELYEEFIGQPVARRATKKELASDECYTKDGLFIFMEQGTVLYADEAEIAGMLADNATLNSPHWRGPDDFSLSNYLEYSLVNMNDSIRGNTESTQIKRAKLLQESLRSLANNYLK
jgi:hypothetical protein